MNALNLLLQHTGSLMQSEIMRPYPHTHYLIILVEYGFNTNKVKKKRLNFPSSLLLFLNVRHLPPQTHMVSWGDFMILYPLSSALWPDIGPVTLR